MEAIVSLYSVSQNEIQKFLTSFYGENNFNKNEISTHWKKSFPNPVEIASIVGAYIENIDDYNLSMWVSIDSGVFIKVTVDNSDELIRYLYERFPY